MAYIPYPQRILRALTVLALTALLLDGCAIGPVTDTDTETEGPEPRAQRESRLQSAWRGRPYQALLETYGSPQMVMGVPGYRPLRTSVIVYGIIDRASDCIDAFTVVADGGSGEWTVADYFCR